MFLIAFLGYLAVSSAIPTPQVLAPAATLTAIPATKHILILTPQAQVQLGPSLKYAQPIVQHLSPVAHSAVDQTVVYVPNENLIAAEGKQLKQLEQTSISSILHQFTEGGQAGQQALLSLHQQLSQGFEEIIQPDEGQKIKGGAAPAAAAETQPRQESGRFYSVPVAIPQFYSNFEVIHTPLNPLFAIQPLQTIRARSVVHPDDKVVANVVAQGGADHLNLAKIASEGLAPQKPQENENQARNTESLPAEQPAQADNIDDKSLKVQKEPELAAATGNSQFGKFLSAIEKRIDAPETPAELSSKDASELKQLDNQAQPQVSVAEAIPSGLAISGEGGLAQARPVASAISGKDGISYSAPSGTAISGSDDAKKGPQSP